MLGNWTVGRKLTLGFAVGVIAVIVVGVIGYRGGTRAAESAEWVTYTNNVEKKVMMLEAAIVDIETDVRGYVITAEAEFLDLNKENRKELDDTFTDLQELTRENEAQQTRWVLLRKVLDERLELLDEQISNTSRGTAVSVERSHELSKRGRETMLQIRALMGEVKVEQERQLVERQSQFQDDTSMARIMIVVGSVVAAILALVAGLWISGSVSKQIGQAVQSVQSSSTELQAAANQQASSSTEQASAMSEIATTISELLATSRQIAESAQRVAQVAAQTASSARGGNQTIVRTNDAAAAVRKQVDRIVTHMLDLGKQSQQIGSVLDLVGELSEQTNILAINASIEAAGAGDAGRRFGVVADEIRKLADRVFASTKEIRMLIENVRTAVNVTVMETEAGSKAVDVVSAGVLESADAFKQISGLVGTTTDAAREIELSTKQQTTAVEQVNQAISNVAQAARETEASASQTLQTSERLSELSADLSRITEAHHA